MLSNYILVLIFYICGIYISHVYDMSYVLFTAVFLLLAGLIYGIRKKHFSVFIILSIVLTLGSVRYYQASENQIISRFPDKYVTASGVIFSSPSISEGTYKYRYVMKLDSISYMGETYETKDKILINTTEPYPFGTNLTAKGFLYPIAGKQNEHEFDFSLYYMGQGIFAHLAAQEVTSQGTTFSLSPAYISGNLRQWASRLIDEHFTSSEAAILDAIITGDKSGFSDEYYTLLLRTGIYRLIFSPFMPILSILLIAGILPLEKGRKNFATILMLLVYAVFGSSSPNSLKASLLCGLLIFQKQVFGYGNKLDLLAKLVLVLTLINPLLCFNTGFIMSVASSVIMYFSYSPIYSYFCNRLRKKKVKHAFSVSRTLTLWIIFIFGTLPIGAYLFKGISIYAAIAMTLFSPVILLILIASPILLLLLQLFGTAPILGTLFAGLSEFLGNLPYYITKLPYYYLSLKVPGILEIAIFYLLWWCFLRGISGKLRTPKTAVIFTIAAGLTVSGIIPSFSDNLQIYFVNVGQGDGAVLHTSRGETVLIDGGGSAEYETTYNVGKRVFVPYLTSHGFTDIDIAILSHPHKDHVEGIIAAAENFKLDTIVMPDTEPSNEYRLALEDIADEKDIRIEYLGANDKIDFNSGLSIRFIAPTPSQLVSPDANESSLVCHVTYGEFSALFTGDSTEQSLIDYPRNIDLLKVAHHGSKNSTSKEFLEHTNPRYAVISAGENNPYNHPSDDVIERLAETETNLLRTDRHGDIRFRIEKDGSFRYATLKGE